MITPASADVGSAHMSVNTQNIMQGIRESIRDQPPPDVIKYLLQELQRSYESPGGPVLISARSVQLAQEAQFARDQVAQDIATLHTLHHTFKRDLDSFIVVNIDVDTSNFSNMATNLGTATAQLERHYNAADLVRQEQMRYQRERTAFHRNRAVALRIDRNLALQWEIDQKAAAADYLARGDSVDENKVRQAAFAIEVSVKRANIEICDLLSKCKDPVEEIPATNEDDAADAQYDKFRGSPNRGNLLKLDDFVTSIKKLVSILKSTTRDMRNKALVHVMASALETSGRELFSARVFTTGQAAVRVQQGGRKDGITQINTEIAKSGAVQDRNRRGRFQLGEWNQNNHPNKRQRAEDGSSRPVYRATAHIGVSERDAADLLKIYEDQARIGQDLVTQIKALQTGDLRRKVGHSSNESSVGTPSQQQHVNLLELGNTSSPALGNLQIEIQRLNKELNHAETTRDRALEELAKMADQGEELKDEIGVFINQQEQMKHTLVQILKNLESVRSEAVGSNRDNLETVPIPQLIDILLEEFDAMSTVLTTERNAARQALAVAEGEGPSSGNPHSPKNKAVRDMTHRIAELQKEIADKEKAYEEAKAKLITERDEAQQALASIQKQQNNPSRPSPRVKDLQAEVAALKEEVADLLAQLAANIDNDGSLFAPDTSDVQQSNKSDARGPWNAEIESLNHQIGILQSHIASLERKASTDQMQLNTLRESSVEANTDYKRLDELIEKLKAQVEQLEKDKAACQAETWQQRRARVRREAAARKGPRAPTRRRRDPALLQMEEWQKGGWKF